jgi:hypothetical protein
MGGNLSAEANWAEVGIFGATVLGMIAGGLMRITSGERRLYRQIDANKTDFIERLSKQRSDLEQYAKEESGNAGDAVAAIRTHVGGVELWVRDNLVRRDEFTTSVTQINRNLDGLRVSVESMAKTTDEKLERMRLSIEGKLDKIVGNRSESGR